MLVAFEGGIDARDLVVTWREGRRALLAFLDGAQAVMEVGLERVVFGFADLAELEAHLCGEQLFAQVRIVVQLGIHGGGDLVEDKAQAADEDGVEDEHQG